MQSGGGLAALTAVRPSSSRVSSTTPCRSNSRTCVCFASHVGGRGEREQKDQREEDGDEDEEEDEMSHRVSVIQVHCIDERSR